jgi:hypothetical protein
MVVASTLAALMTTCGVAFAYWALIGSGSASAASGAFGPVTVAAFSGGDAPTSALAPGGSSDVVLRVNNANAFPIVLTAVALNGTITASGGIGTCTTTGVTVNFPSNPSITVPGGSHLIDLAGAASMNLTAQNGCQGATFHIPVSITFQK